MNTKTLEERIDARYPGYSNTTEAYKNKIKGYIDAFKLADFDDDLIIEQLGSKLKEASSSMSTLTDDLNRMVDTENELDNELDALQFMYSPLAQLFLPQRKTDDVIWVRESGLYELTWVSKNGIPYGVAPRLMLVYIMSLAKKYKIKKIPLGRSMNAFMRAMGVTPVSGKEGNIKAYTDQLLKLSTTLITVESSTQADSESHISIKNTLLFDEVDLWFTDGFENAEAYVVINDRLFQALLVSAVPLSLNAIKKLKSSPLALDIYMFITYRSNKPTNRPIPWRGIRDQFGSGQKCITNFKTRFLVALAKVKEVYPECNAVEGKGGLLLNGSRPHIRSIEVAEK
jgi:hypothetical protein